MYADYCVALMWFEKFCEFRLVKVICMWRKKSVKVMAELVGPAPLCPHSSRTDLFIRVMDRNPRRGAKKTVASEPMTDP